ncbi:hypothetical protein MADA3029_740080 [Vibrio nigripulchritudo MADA3029]|uniref:zincin-like metallopeptidase domain-containing protein n=1 Tax=Vibrio nigripulchritudo TaxID=28173 RepID=UPI0003B1D6DD|nr:zincin-like metallopeptidase domain-containing protein [Vibrio nigripulchritudo]CCN49176.1 hypothetical protein VIBNIMADA3020_710015 [Vibrio nigripulchritudo MADA3020]CCN54159.1 hypothetical protein VIBNIMADA3021_510082 [Vibrio nigripulchritudo MADA3021]CCN61229.1 hypothetical protein MADA3029_740080 [Vibrio nigripulchritudo MADA3029]
MAKVKSTWSKNTDKSKYTNPDRQKKAEQEYKQTFSDEFLRFFEEDLDAKFDPYIHPSLKSMRPRIVRVKEGKVNIEKCSFNQSIQFKNLDCDRKPKVPVYLTYAELMNLIIKYKKEIKEEHNLEFKLPKELSKGIKSKISLINTLAKYYDKEEKKEYWGDSIGTHKEELAKKLSKEQIDERFYFIGYQYKKKAYFALEDFKHCLPKKLFDSIPQFQLVDKVMSPEQVHIENKVVADVMQEAITRDYSNKISFHNNADIDVAHAKIWEGKNVSQVVMANHFRFTDHTRYTETLFHEATHSAVVLNPHTSVKSYATEEGIAQIGTVMLCDENEVDYDPSNSVAYLRSWGVKDVKDIGNILSKTKQRIEPIIKSMKKHDSQELRQHFRDILEEEIKQQYDLSNKQVEELKAKSKRSVARP